MAMFEVLTLGEFLNKRGIEITIRSFADFYHSVTPKHQRSITMNYIDDSNSNTAYLNHLLEINDIKNQVRVLNDSTDEEKLEILHKTALLSFPSEESAGMVIPEVLSYGIPVLCMECEGLQEFIDPTCGLIVKYEGLGQSVEEFSDMLKILYFDPEVRKILKKGALRRYEKYFSWGLPEYKVERLAG